MDVAVDAAVQLQIHSLADFQLGQQVREQPPLADFLLLAQTVKTPQQLKEPAPGKLSAEIVGGHVFDVMGLVQYDSRVTGQDGRVGVAACFAAHGQIGEQEVVIGDEQIGRGRLAASIVKEAVVVERTAHARTVVAFTGHLFPDGRLRHNAEVGPAAVPGLMSPLQQGFQLGALFRLNQVFPIFFQIVDFVETDIVLASLHQDRFELERKRALEQRKIFVKKLLLKVDRVG